MENLDLVVDSIDAIPDAFRPFYAEQDGKFRLKVNGVEDTEGLKKSLNTINRESTERRKALEQWRSLGKSPEEIAELLKHQEDRERTEAEKRGEWEKLRAQMNEKHDAELKAERANSQKKDAALQRYLVDSAATAAIAEAKGVPILLLPHVRSSVKVIEENGNFEVRVVDDKGDIRVDGKGKFLTIADLVGEMRQSDVFGRAFDGSGRSGSGMQPGNTGTGGGPTGPNPWAKGQENLTTQEMMIRDIPEQARRLALAAGITPDW